MEWNFLQHSEEAHNKKRYQGMEKTGTGFSSRVQWTAVPKAWRRQGQESPLVSNGLVSPKALSQGGLAI